MLTFAFMHHPCLVCHTFWHAIPTSSYIFYFLYIYIYIWYSFNQHIHVQQLGSVSCLLHSQLLHTLYLGRWVSSTVLTKIIVSRSRAILPWGRSRYAHVWELKAYMHVLHQKPYLWTVFSETWGFQNVLLYTSWWQQCHPEQEEGVAPQGFSHIPLRAETDTLPPHIHYMHTW